MRICNLYLINHGVKQKSITQTALRTAKAIDVIVAGLSMICSSPNLLGSLVALELHEQNDGLCSSHIVIDPDATAHGQKFDTIQSLYIDIDERSSTIEAWLTNLFLASCQNLNSLSIDQPQKGSHKFLQSLSNTDGFEWTSLRHLTLSHTILSHSLFFGLFEAILLHLETLNLYQVSLGGTEMKWQQLLSRLAQSTQVLRIVKLSYLWEDGPIGFQRIGWGKGPWDPDVKAEVEYVATEEGEDVSVWLKNMAETICERFQGEWEV